MPKRRNDDEYSEGRVDEYGEIRRRKKKKKNSSEDYNFGMDF